MNVWKAEQIADTLLGRVDPSEPVQELNWPGKSFALMLRFIRSTHPPVHNFEDVPLQNGIDKLREAGYNPTHIHSFLTALEYYIEEAMEINVAMATWDAGAELSFAYEFDPEWPFGIKVLSTSHGDLVGNRFRSKIYDDFVRDLKVSAVKHPEILLPHGMPGASEAQHDGPDAGPR